MKMAEVPPLAERQSEILDGIQELAVKMTLIGSAGSITALLTLFKKMNEYADQGKRELEKLEKRLKEILIQAKKDDEEAMRALNDLAPLLPSKMAEDLNLTRMKLIALMRTDLGAIEPIPDTLQKSAATIFFLHPHAQLDDPT
ncbi:hypothetical protein ABJI51_21250 [Amycolatopsis sp. NEAU-NG30]|uniref:Uncharacterized protein n=1 Tax=Amycolatopsis melonis TaxID=3156488 RepID=A0ABV0LH44_9PSEU